jgi:hypothetical protein
MIVLTFDTDWAPQFVIDEVMAILREAGVKATFFYTSSYWGTDDPLFERAIHPNFMSGSTQGASEDEILRRLKTWYPDAVGSRSHRLYWHSGLAGRLSNVGILYDSSLILPFHQNLEPFEIQGMTRFPFWWSDPLHLARDLPFSCLQLPNVDRPGLKVFNFHPIHIYLNTSDLGNFSETMKKVQPFIETTPDVLSNFREQECGIRTMFVDVLEYVNTHQSETVHLKDLLSIRT